MVVGSAKEFVRTLNAAIDYAREHKLGIFGAANSDAFLARLERDYDKAFGKSEMMSSTRMPLPKPELR